MKKAIVVGKFWPPHKGHHFLIDYALKHSDNLTVLVCDHPRYTIPAERRAAWLAARHPKAAVKIIKDIGKDDDSAAWAKHTIKFLGFKPDAVFSSEDYGDEYARLMGAVHHKVDRERRHVPISATVVREDVLKKWDFMEPPIRAGFAIRVCVLGAESTGTTTLSKALADYYETAWVPEYGRLYSEALQVNRHDWQSHEFTFIAEQQQAMENELAGQCSGLLICDTNAFATQLWHERYMGSMSPEVDAIAAKDKPDLYVITDVDIPFVDDGIRDGEHIRHAMHQRFIDEVAATGIPYLVVGGTVKRRLRTVVSEIDKLIAKGVKI